MSSTEGEKTIMWKIPSLNWFYTKTSVEYWGRLRKGTDEPIAYLLPFSILNLIGILLTNFNGNIEFFV